MKVKELMALLEKCNPNSNVYVGADGYSNYDLCKNTYSKNATTRYILYEDGSILLCDSNSCYYPEQDWLMNNDTFKVYYNVISNDGTINENFESEEDAIEYAENVFADEIDLDFEIDVYYVKEKLEYDDQWHIVDDYIIQYYSKQEAYS